MSRFNNKEVVVFKAGDKVRLNWQDTRDSKVYAFLEKEDEHNDFVLESITGGLAKVKGVPFPVKVLDLLPERSNKLKVK